MARGEGLGQEGRRQGLGPVRKCVCPQCGYEVNHEPGTPCSYYVCPKCNIRLVGK